MAANVIEQGAAPYFHGGLKSFVLWCKDVEDKAEIETESLGGTS